MFLTIFVQKFITMKKYTMMHIASLFRIFVLITVTGCLLTACGETPEKEKTLKGTITPDTEGKIVFMYSRLLDRYPESCTFTTNLPDPDNRFILTIPSGELIAKKEINGLNAGQKVTWTATVEGKPLNHGSEHFVHIIND